MQHTSDTQDLKSFFTREQLYAFSQPPSELAVSQVKKQGSDQDYLSGEYIRLVLNRYIGPGMYDLKVALVGEPMREIIKKDKWENRQKVGTIDNVAVTANVSVEIVIYAPDGSGRTRHYSAVGSHTMYGAAESGAGAIVGNAIKSAETSGLKRAVQPLGRAFGLDLKNKVKDNALPPGIGHFRRLLEERDEKNRQAAEMQPAIAHETPAIEMRPSQSGREQSERTETTERSEAQPVKTQGQNRAEAQPQPQAEEPREPAQTQGGPARTRSDEGRDVRPQAEPQTRQRQESPAHEPEVSGGRAQNRAEQAPAARERTAEPRSKSDDGAQDAGPVGGAGAADKAAEEPRKEQDWELSITPSNYNDWVSCMKTMTRRVNAMTNEKELLNFAKRNSKIIDALPSYPAEGDQNAKDFGLRWKIVMARRFEGLGLPVPEKYAPPADAKQPA
jgi:hypothetical protein